jgi:hypothetical protein
MGEKPPPGNMQDPYESTVPHSDDQAQ